jgi:hypothetical protein
MVMDGEPRSFGVRGSGIPSRAHGVSKAWGQLGGFDMDSTTIIRIVAGVLFVIVLIVLIQRRRTRVK